MVNHLIHDAFGKVTSESNSAVDSLFLFTARPFDSDTQLQNNLNRWYDARVGRWLSEDPVGFNGGVNLYRYVLNTPTNRLDPRGTVTIVWSCCSDDQVKSLQDNFASAERAARAAAMELRQLLDELNVKASGPWGIGLDWPEAYHFSNRRLEELRRALDRWFATPVGEPTPGGYRRVGVIYWDTLYTVVETAENIAKAFDGTIRVECDSSCSEGYIAYRSQSLWSYLRGTTDVIHLCPVFFEKSNKERSGFLLHEISHIYASTVDYAYLGAPGNERYAPQYWTTSILGQEIDVVLESSQLAQNAATYQGFFEYLYL
ncbi:MAG: RHS repeat-associated core domain-containing protein [Thermogutta sp.]